MNGKTIVFGRSGGHDWSSFWSQLVSGHYHLWYLPMTIGLYIVVPILRPVAANRERIFYMVVLAGVWNMGCLILYQTGILPNLYTFTGKLQMNLPSGWIFYFALGYFVASCDIKKRLRVILYVSAIVSQGTAVLWTIYEAKQGIDSYYVHCDYAINRCLTVMAVFVFFRYLFCDERVRSWIDCKQGLLKAFSSLTLGAYLLHPFFIEKRAVFHYALDGRNPIWAVPVMTIIVAVLSFVASWMLHRIPVVRKWIV